MFFNAPAAQAIFRALLARAESASYYSKTRAENTEGISVLHMALFDAPSDNTPNRWKDYSPDLQLWTVFWGCIMALFMFGSFLTLNQEIAVYATLAVILVAVSVKRRQQNDWRWQGAKPKDVLAAIGVIVAGVVFDFVASPSFPWSNPRFLPWHLAGVSIAVFGVLFSLNLVQTSKADYLKRCEPSTHGRSGPASTSEKSPAVPVDLTWKRAVRAVYYTFAVAVWLDFMAWFYEFGVAFDNGSPIGTPANPDPLNNHGLIRYITHSQNAFLNSLDTISSIGIPATIAAGFILHFFLGVKMFENMPTFEEWRKKR